MGDKRDHFMKFWAFLAPILSAACVTSAADAAKSYKYVNLGGETEYTYFINPEKRTLAIGLPGPFDPPPNSIEICDKQTGFICFYEKGRKFGFGVPRSGFSGNQSWEIDDQSFKVMRELSNPHCGVDYIIESADDDGPVGLFSFNYATGLRSMLFVDSVETVVLEEVTGDVYRYGPVYFADGPGFGGSVTCATD